MPPEAALDTVFAINPEIEPALLAPEQVRQRLAAEARENEVDDEEGYSPTSPDGAFCFELAIEDGPDGSRYAGGARWGGVMHMAYQEDEDRNGFFIGRSRTPEWRWVLWHCFWDDDNSDWFWSAAVASTMGTDDPAEAAEEMLRQLWLKWASWNKDEPPVEIDVEGLLGWAKVRAISDEVFGPPQESPDDEDEEESD